MLKLLAFFVVIILFFRMIGLVFRLLLGGFSTSKMNQQGDFQNGRRKKDGNINIDYVPKNGGNNKQKKDFRGGEYVDFEEVDK